MIALLRYSRLRRHATTAFVISLSCSDFIFSAVNMPLTASRYLNEAWILGDTLCQIFPLFFYGNVAVSLLSMVAITVNRWVIVVYNFVTYFIYIALQKIRTFFQPLYTIGLNIFNDYTSTKRNTDLCFW